MALTLLLLLVSAQPPGDGTVVVVQVVGRIDYGAWLTVSRAVGEVKARKAQALIVIVDTYGGYLDAADRIVRELGSCQCRVIAWVPPGGKAVSAGTLVALGAQKLYVAAGSVVGACKPIPEDEKVVEYVKARLRSLVGDRGEEIVEELNKMVTENKAFSAEEAVALGLAERADSLEEVLRREGLSGAWIVEVNRDLIAEVAAIILDPGVAMLMLITGILLILLEVKAAGFQGWGVVGGVLIALALYALNIVGPNLLALSLLALGIVLIIAELKKPGIQVFGIAGILLLTVATVLEYFRTPYLNPLEYVPPVAAFTAFIAGFLLLTISKALEAAQLERPTLEKKLVGKTGVAKTDIGPSTPGVVYVEGEDWTAYSDEKIEKGCKVVVKAVRGITLIVGRVDEERGDKA